MYINEPFRWSSVNDGLMTCIDHQFYIRDLNFNIISESITIKNLNNLDFLEIKLDYLDSNLLDIYVWPVGHFYLAYMPVMNFKEYKSLYSLHLTLFHYSPLNNNIYKIPNNIYIMLHHTNLLSKKVIDNCLLIFNVLLYDISTIVIPLTLELVRNDYSLYENKT